MVDTEYGPANTEIGFPKHDTQLSASEKPTALREMQNGNQNSVPKFVGTSPIPKESGPVKVFGTKRPMPECPVSLPHHQSPTNTAVNGRLVYVRRKADAELGKSNISGSTSNKTDFPQPKKLGDQNDKNLQQSQMKDSRVCASEAAVGLPSGKPSVPLLLGKFNNNSQPADSDYHRPTTAITSLECPKKTNELHWEERFFRLQNLLKILDQSVHDGYVQMLQSLNSVELSRLAVELEKRSIHLSLEEVKEMQRVRQLDVLGKYHSRESSSQQQNQSEKNSNRGL